MSRAEKLLERMRANPAGDWTIADVERLCRDHDLTCLPPRGGGSHHKIAHKELAEILSMPSRRPIKPIYIRNLVQMVDDVVRQGA